MITIDQLLESVDLDFEPRWVTKDQVGMVWLWEKKPQAVENWWENTLSLKEIGGKIKISEFENKHWQECIYEVPRKTDEYEQNLEKLRPADSDLVYRVKLPRKTTGKIEHFFNECGDDIVDEREYQMTGKAIKKLNLLVDAVNELKGGEE